MKIEFRKVPQTPKELEVEYNSVKIEGTFCKISQSLVKVDAVLLGNTDIDCGRCGIAEVIEVENNLIDFDEIIESELNSIKSDYHICKDCLQLGDNFEKEF